MAEKYQPDQVQQGSYPLAPATVVPRSDEEYGNNNHRSQSEEQMKKKKRMKCFAYIAVFAVFQVAVILVFSLTVMRVKTPKVRLEDVAVTATPNGDVRLTARLIVKNTNFGRYKYESTLATIASSGQTLSQFAIQEARANARSTKKVAITEDLAGSNTGTLDLVVEARLQGKVELMKIIKRKKKADMYCTFTVVVATNTVQNLTCK